MTRPPGRWVADRAECWAEALGLAFAPLYGDLHEIGADAEAGGQGSHAALMDGPAHSIALAVMPAFDLEYTPALRSATWSARLSTQLVASVDTGELWRLTWRDSQAPQAMDLPRSAADARAQFESLPRPARTAETEVIDFVLAGFRRVRAVEPDGLAGTRLLNAMLFGTEAALRGWVDRDRWEEARTRAHVAEIIDSLRAVSGLASIVDAIGLDGDACRLDELPRYFLSAESWTNHRFDPALLLRHAAGPLYEAAHHQVRPEEQLSLFPGLAEASYLGGEPAPFGVHFTPPTVARALVHQAIEALPPGWPEWASLDVLDPACGSGVFLLEALRELTLRGFGGSVALRGFDSSQIAATTARFVLSRALVDEGRPGWTLEVTHGDALERDWGRPNLVLMNPPFIRWKHLPPELRAMVASAVGARGPREPDLALAFVLRAADATAPAGGAMATILPAQWLEAESGQRWRDELRRTSDVRLLARLRGFGYLFRVMVEPACVVLSKPPSSETERPVVDVLISQPREGSADKAWQLLRLGVESAGPETSAEYYRASQCQLGRSWMPRRRCEFELLARVHQLGLPSVKDLFSVNKGVETGLNEAFIIEEQEWLRLRPGERSYFRKAPRNEDVVNGRITGWARVFYPYDADGPSITTEEQLRARLQGYSMHLDQHVDRLSRRRQAQFGWWLLNYPRSWDLVTVPKLISSHFGRAGSFALDGAGEVTPVGGFIWRRRGVDPRSAGGQHMLCAYLALLNSPVFETLLGLFCPKLASGVLEIEPRHVNAIPVPNLLDAWDPESPTVRLAELGRQIQQTGLDAVCGLRDAALRAYGLGGEFDEL